MKNILTKYLLKKKSIKINYKFIKNDYLVMIFE
ncbi:hypothetical protein ES708_05631 [subsurface metagenome]